MKFKPVLKSLATAAALVVLASSAFAAPQTTNNANFSISYDDGTRFGTLTLIGNAISFDFSNPASPLPWIAEATNTAGLVTASGAVVLTLTINNTAFANGYRFGSVTWVEGGDYSRSSASTSVGVSGSLSAVNANLASTTTASSLTVDAPGFATIGALNNTDWFARAQLDSSTACSGVGCTNVFASDAQTMVLTVSNDLTASSVVNGDLAFIEKKLGAGSFTLLVSQVPEASTWTMLLAGLGAVGWLARRRRA